MKPLQITCSFKEPCYRAQIAECAGLVMGRVAAAMEQLRYDKNCLVRYNVNVVNDLIRSEIYKVKAEGLFTDRVTDAMEVEQDYYYGVLTLSWKGC